MEIQVKLMVQNQPSRRVRPLPNPLTLLADQEIVLYHGGCGGHVSFNPDDRNDFEAYTTVRCDLCFETYREKQSTIARALTDVLVEGTPSDACTVLRFSAMSSREMFATSPIATKLQRLFFGSNRHRR